MYLYKTVTYVIINQLDFIFNIRQEHEMGRACSTYGEKSNACRILVEKPEGKRPIGRTRCKWEDNITMDFRVTEWAYVGWIHLAQNRDQWNSRVNTTKNLRVP
jgi:hypothetical protein